MTRRDVIDDAIDEALHHVLPSTGDVEDLLDQAIELSLEYEGEYRDLLANDDAEIAARRADPSGDIAVLAMPHAADSREAAKQITDTELEQKVLYHAIRGEGRRLAPDYDWGYAYALPVKSDVLPDDDEAEGVTA